MGCPQCESKNTSPTQNINESFCIDCGCEFKESDTRVTVYSRGTYHRFVESVFDDINTKVLDPSVSAALRSNVTGHLNEGERSLRNLISEMITNAEDLHNLYTSGMKEKEDFTAVMEAIDRLYTWAKLNEQADIIPEGYYDDEDEGEVDLDAIMGGGDDNLDYNSPVDMDIDSDSMSDDEIDQLAGIGETDNVNIGDEIDSIIGSETIDASFGNQECDMDIPMDAPIEDLNGGLPASNDIAVDRIQSAAAEIQNAVDDLTIANGDDEEETPVGHGVTMMAPQVMGQGSGFISEGFAFKLGDRVFIDNVTDECIVMGINESRITVKNAHGDATTIDLGDEYRERDIQFAFTEDADIIMERSAASADTLKEKYLAMMDSIENENMGVNFAINESVDGSVIDFELDPETMDTPEEEMEEGANSNWNQDPEVDPDVLKSYPDKLNMKGAVGGESVEKDGEVLEEGTDDTGLGMDSESGLGHDVDEGGEDAAEKTHNMDGEVTSSVEVADDESDGIVFPDVGDNTGVEELHEEMRNKLREELAAQLSEGQDPEDIQSDEDSKADDDISDEDKDEAAAWLHGNAEKIKKAKDDLEESVINDHFHTPDGTPMPFPYTQDPTNSASKALKDDKMEEDKEKQEESNKKIGIEESALKGLREGDVINRNEDFKTQWTVTKIDRSPLKVHLKCGMKTGVFNPMKEGFQYIDGVDLGYERGLEGIESSKDTWAKMEESINSYDKKGLTPLRESVDANLESEEVVTELAVITKEELYKHCKENELHRTLRNETLQELVKKFGNPLEEMERILDDVALSESDESIDASYGVHQMGELDTHFALKNAYAQMEAALAEDGHAFSVTDQGGRPKTDNSEETLMKGMGAADDIVINLNENQQWFNL